MSTKMIRANQYSSSFREALRCGRETRGQQLLGLLARSRVKAFAVDRPRVRDAIRRGLEEAKPLAIVKDADGYARLHLLGMVGTLAEMAAAPLADEPDHAAPAEEPLRPRPPLS